MKINQKAPGFSLPNQDGEILSLQDFKGRWLVLYFYPKDNTPGCTIEAIDFTKLKKEFAKEGAEVIGVSPDSEKSHCNFIEKRDLKITLLSDAEKTILNDYDVWGKKKFMGKEYMGVIRSTFLINSKGVIKHIWSNVKVKDHAQEVLEKLKELRE